MENMPTVEIVQTSNAKKFLPNVKKWAFPEQLKALLQSWTALPAFLRWTVCLCSLVTYITAFSLTASTLAPDAKDDVRKQQVEDNFQNMKAEQIAINDSL